MTHNYGRPTKKPKSNGLVRKRGGGGGSTPSSQQNRFYALGTDIIGNGKNILECLIKLSTKYWKCPNHDFLYFSDVNSFVLY